MIIAKNITFKYANHDRAILDNINLHVKPGEIVIITGLSGCGKTTLAKVLTGLIPKRFKGDFSGTVSVDGEDIANMEMPEIAIHIGIMHQDPNGQILFSQSEIEVAFALENFCVSRENMRKTVDEIASTLNIVPLMKRNPNTLSGGEKQLVVLAAILVMGVKALVLDEAMAEVDEQGKQRIIESIKTLKNDGKAIVMIEHDRHNYCAADRVLKLEDGKLIEVTSDA